MKKLLITGFEPFGGERVNPSWEAVEALPDRIGDYSLTRLALPVVFGKAAKTLIDAADSIQPDVILSVGQAGGRASITPELVGINLRHATIPDNEGNEPKDEPIVEGGAAAYFSTLPLRRMVCAISSLGIAAQLSYSAGTYVCNDVIYTLLSHLDGSAVRFGFIHVPYSPEQGKEPNMPISDVIRALVAAIECLDGE
jgi:pyroglutamyl-peptidase